MIIVLEEPISVIEKELVTFWVEHFIPRLHSPALLNLYNFIPGITTYQFLPIVRHSRYVPVLQHVSFDPLTTALDLVCVVLENAYLHFLKPLSHRTIVH